MAASTPSWPTAGRDLGHPHAGGRWRRLAGVDLSGRAGGADGPATAHRPEGADRHGGPRHRHGGLARCRPENLPGCHAGRAGRRRYREVRARGEETDYETVLASMRRRDGIDSNRKASPLCVAEGAVVLDTTGLSVEGVLAEGARLVEEQGCPPDSSPPSPLAAWPNGSA